MNSASLKTSLDYEFIEYKPNDRTNWRHSTKMDQSDRTKSKKPLNTGLLESLKPIHQYTQTRTLIRQQTQILIERGYYLHHTTMDNDSLSPSHKPTEILTSTTDSSKCNCSCSNGSGSYCTCSNNKGTSSSTDLSTEIPSSLVTKSAIENTVRDWSDDERLYSLIAAESTGESDVTEDESPIYVCSNEFKSAIGGDLSLANGELVRLLHIVKSNDYFLVKSLQTFKCGFVPRFCLAPFV